ncbi:MAG: 50S ribosomal protein L6, partial [Bacteroidota bacterium]
MSRIGKLPVSLPKGVTVSVAQNNMVTVKGAKGELKLKVDPDMTIDVKDGSVEVKRPTDSKRHKSLHG